MRNSGEFVRTAAVREVIIKELKNMKKILAVILSIILFLSFFTGCAGDTVTEYPIQTAMLYTVESQSGTFTTKINRTDYVYVTYRDSSGEIIRCSSFLSNVKFADENKVVVYDEDKVLAYEVIYLTQETYAEVTGSTIIGDLS